MSHSFEAIVGGSASDGGVPFLEVPKAIVAALGGGKRPRVVVRVHGHSYRSTVAVYGGKFFLPLNRQNKAAAGVELGEQVTVTVERDDAPREVELPPELAEALATRPQLGERFARLSYSHRREWAEAVAGAKKPETRQRRIEKLLAELAG